MDDTDRRLLDDQVAYYRARAPQYDWWWERSHHYALEPDLQVLWQAEQRQLDRWFEGLRLGGTVLELACGTGIWTQRLAQVASQLTAVDAAPETIELNRARLQSTTGEAGDAGDSCRTGRVRYFEADLFDWTPPARYDAVFFSFWLSHVPPDRFDAFWEMVADALLPSGRAVFIDNRWSPRTWPARRPDDGEYVQERNDVDGHRSFCVVKRYYEPAELTERLTQLGWACDIQATETYFIMGEAQRA